MHGEKSFALRDATAAMFEQRDARANDPAFLAEARIALTSMMELPGNRATRSAGEIAPSSDVDPARAQAILDLFSLLVEDVAICVEVKANTLSSAARRGNVQRLSVDLRDVVGNATAQALRLEDHIRTNGGLWLEDRTWLDLSEIREIRSVTVFLDDFGPISTALDKLVRADVIKSERFPWLITLHDLTIIAEVMDRPAEFLFYLRRRTESEVSLTFNAIDELDLFMLFLAKNLWVEPHPDRVSEEFLGVPRPAGMERRRYRESATPTRVMTHTDPLDAWVYYQEGSSAEDAPKPVFEEMLAVNDLVNFLQDGRKPGWFRFSADLLNLAEEGQESVVEMIQLLVRTTASDGLRHNSLMTFVGAWGYPTLFMGTKPKGTSDHEANHRRAIYGFAKDHQIKSDRALMVIFDEAQQVRSVRTVCLEWLWNSGQRSVRSSAGSSVRRISLQQARSPQ